MRFNSLRARIAFVVVLLTLTAQAAAFVVINSVIKTNAMSNAQEQLSVAERVFAQVVRSHSEKLTQATSIVAADFGFREAVATHDENTVVSALRNHGSRVSADLVMLVDLAGKLEADSRGPVKDGEPFPFPGLMRNATKGGNASAIGVIDGRLYQLVAVAVRAPLPVAWVVMGFLVDDKMAREMAALTSLEVSFLHRRADDGRWHALASSLPQSARAYGSPAEFADKSYATRILSWPSSGEPVVVVLQRSLKAALAPFNRLHSALLAITLAGILLSVAGST